MISIDVVAVQGIAGELATSGRAVLSLASSVRTAATEVNPSHAGQCYEEVGRRLSPACADLAGVLARWGIVIGDCATALQRSIATYRQQDRSTSAALAAEAELLA